MQTLKCIAMSKSPNNIILFGLVIPIVRRNPDDLTLHCVAEDEYGNKYNVYTDYGMALEASRTVAVKRGEQ